MHRNWPWLSTLMALSAAAGMAACNGSDEGPGISPVNVVGGASGFGNSAGATNQSGTAASSAASGTEQGMVADGSCHDTQSDPAHCGNCMTACAAGQICAAGVCRAPTVTCTAPQLLCSGACADLTSAAHCGTCENACEAGQSCLAGVCQCPGAQVACSGACTDTQTSADHCGGCSQPCATGAVCSAGKCQCATGQDTCSGVCVDLKQSDANCGACNQACSAGQKCSAGVCVSGVGADACSGSALGVSLSQIAVYQTVKVPVMDAGSEVTADKRTSDVVSGRPTLFRVSINVDSGFVARQLSARVTLNNGSSAAQYFGKLTVSKSSLDTDPTTTFQVFVPAEQITADTRYTVELVECSKGSGNAGATRFPPSSDVPLGARLTGGLKITVIPLLANDHLPDTTDTALEVYRQALLAMYPIDAVDISVGTQMTIAYPVDWEATLDQMRTRRRTDNPAADVYYFGLLKPQDTFAKFCGNGCTSGIGYVAAANSPSYRAAVGAGFADRASAQTMAHEVGHNHGRNHSPCVPSGGMISGVDPNYPFPDGRTGVVGYDSRTKVLLSADKSTDLMGYCSNVWLSEYTYGGLTDRVALVNGNKFESVNRAALKIWRVLLLGGKAPHWGAPITQPSLPEGDPLTARILNAAGALIAEVQVYRTDISDGGGASIMVPEPKSGWASVQVPGAVPVGF